MSGAAPTLHTGLLAEFASAEAMSSALRSLRDKGFDRLEAYTPYPVGSAQAAMGLRRTRVAWAFFIGGLIGGTAAYALQWWVHAVEYPLNIGGKPTHSAPAFIPVTFELTVLIAALSAVLGMLALNGLPRPYHPVFHVDEFIHASRDRFYLIIEASDPKFDRQETARFLESLPVHEVYEVGH